MAFRVINWATGHTGKMVVRAVAERPEYEIAGAFVYNPEKIGRDLGELCGINPIGVKTTGDRHQIRDAAADCVLFLAGAENDVPGSIEHICMLLASGKNVITIAANLISHQSLGTAI